MKKLFAMTVAVLLLFSVLLGIPAAYGQAPETGKTLDILFSHDTHSHLNTFTTVVDEKEAEIGGFARANTLIKAQRAKDPDTLVIDGGDFSMGTLIQTVFETQAAELRMLGYMGYDVTTFGNHEFDYRSKGLANMLTSARTSGDAVPSIVVCNVDWDAMEAAGLTEGQQMLKDAFAAYGVQDYTVLQKGDVRIAVVGVFGKDALSCAPTCELKFKDPVQAVKATVAEIKANENADMIVCVSHSGTVRDTYARGDITVEQVFNSFSLGIGADGVPGYPLIEVYLTGKELRTAAEIDASVSDFMTTARLYCSGLNFTYNPHRLLLNKVTDVYLVKDGQRVELQDDKLYRIVADLYSGQMLSAVTDMSYGILSIVPKYADGTPIEDFEDVILTENGRELKGWDAIARYMASFEDTDGDGIGNVPDYYSTLHDRKKVEDSRSLSALLKKPNRFTFILLGLILTVILLVVCLVLLLRKLVRKLRRRKKAR